MNVFFFKIIKRLSHFKIFMDRLAKEVYIHGIWLNRALDLTNSNATSETLVDYE